MFKPTAAAAAAFSQSPMESVRSAFATRALPNPTPIRAPGNPRTAIPPPWQCRARRSAALAMRTGVQTMRGLQFPKAAIFEESGGGEGSAGRRKKLAVFVSGGGSNFRAIHEAAVTGTVRGDVAVLVTDKPGCGGAEYARDNGIPVLVFPESKSSTDGLSPADLVSTLRNFEVDFVLLAGYLKLVPAELVQAYPRSIVNIHPSLLPAFGGKGYYGLKVHKAVIAYGARYSGATVHFVDEHYDTGSILAQRVVPVLADDTAEGLAARVLHEEHQVYVEVVSALCEDRVVWRADGVPLVQSRDNPDEYK